MTLRIEITRDTVDHIHERKIYKTYAGAKNYLTKWYGEDARYNDSPNYITDDYGVGVSYISGASIKEIFAGEKIKFDSIEDYCDYEVKGDQS